VLFFILGTIISTAPVTMTVVRRICEMLDVLQEGSHWDLGDVGAQALRNTV
jgi:hypothetical protein